MQNKDDKVVAYSPKAQLVPVLSSIMYLPI